MNFIGTDFAPTPGAYSQAIAIDLGPVKLMFLAGQTANDPNTKNQACVPEDNEGNNYGPQTTRCLENILAIIKAGGGDADSIVRLVVFLKDPGTQHLQKKSRVQFNDAYMAFFEEHGVESAELPARTQVWVSEIPWESEPTVVEIQADAVITNDSVPSAWLSGSD